MVTLGEIESLKAEGLPSVFDDQKSNGWNEVFFSFDFRENGVNYVE